MPLKVLKKLFSKTLKKKKKDSYQNINLNSNSKTKISNDPRSPKKKRTPLSLIN